MLYQFKKGLFISHLAVVPPRVQLVILLLANLWTHMLETVLLSSTHYHVFIIGEIRSIAISLLDLMRYFLINSLHCLVLLSFREFVLKLVNFIHEFFILLPVIRDHFS